MFAKHAYVKTYRGFESLTLRTTNGLHAQHEGFFYALPGNESKKKDVCYYKSFVFVSGKRIKKAWMPAGQTWLWW